MHICAHYCMSVCVCVCVCTCVCCSQVSKESAGSLSWSYRQVVVSCRMWTQCNPLLVCPLSCPPAPLLFWIHLLPVSLALPPWHSRQPSLGIIRYFSARFPGSAAALPCCPPGCLPLSSVALLVGISVAQPLFLLCCPGHPQSDWEHSSSTSRYSSAL